jgi:hypothetical protein
VESEVYVSEDAACAAYEGWEGEECGDGDGRAGWEEKFWNDDFFVVLVLLISIRVPIKPRIFNHKLLSTLAILFRRYSFHSPIFKSIGPPLSDPQHRQHSSPRPTA